MSAFQDHILANSGVRTALLAGDSGAIRDWYRTHKHSTVTVSRKLNRDGLLAELGLQTSVAIIARLRAFSDSPHPWGLAVAELVRLIDGGSGPDFGDQEVQDLIGGLSTGVPTEAATELLPAIEQQITVPQAEAMLELANQDVSWGEHFLGRQPTIDDIDETLRPVRQPGSTLLLPDVAEALE